MAELLLYFKPSVNDLTRPADPGRRLGDIIHALPDGSQWGRQECLDDFLVIRVDGLAYEDAVRFSAPLMRETLTGIYEHLLDSVREILANYVTSGVMPSLETVLLSRYAVDMVRLDYDEVARAYSEDWYVPIIGANDFMTALVDKANAY